MQFRANILECIGLNKQKKAFKELCSILGKSEEEVKYGYVERGATGKDVMLEKKLPEKITNLMSKDLYPQYLIAFTDMFNQAN